MRGIDQSATTLGRRPRRRRTLTVVLVGLLLLALLEIAVLILVGDRIGPLWTILLIIASGMLGLWLLRREGGRSLRALRAAVQAGETPSRQIADAVLVLVGGALLLLPGFVSDVLGLLLVLPVTRPVARPLLEASIARRVFLDLGTVRATPSGSTGSGRSPRGRGQTSPDEVIEGEIVDD